MTSMRGGPGHAPSGGAQTERPAQDQGENRTGRDAWIRRVTAGRRDLPRPALVPAEPAAEGGCGVIGLASSVPVAGKHLLRSLAQMRNRGNGKGGGIAAVGLDPHWLGTDRDTLQQDTLLAVAYLEPTVRETVEREHIRAAYEVDHVREIGTLDDLGSIEGLDVRPPEVVIYLVRPRPDELAAFAESFTPQHGRPPTQREIEDEYVYRASFRLNVAHYAGAAGNQAFVLSHGRNLLVLKMVGYADDVIRWYRLEDLDAHVWIGHHRYPTKGRVWHPGGAHPFIGVNEALVHNGDFANYASVSDYLAQRGYRPLFQTDTEVAAQVFDLHHRLYGYPLEQVIESMAPTTERDYALLPEDRRRLYHALQVAHMHGSPDGPWFFIIAQSAPDAWRLIGITDTSMLRPQVFALQEGDAQIAFAASEKQVIDAALESLSADDPRFWPRADRYWAARGGSHTDGGAFTFAVRPEGDGRYRLDCSDKFGHPVTLDSSAPSHRQVGEARNGRSNGRDGRTPDRREAARESEPAHESAAAGTASGAPNGPSRGPDSGAREADDGVAGPPLPDVAPSRTGASITDEIQSRMTGASYRWLRGALDGVTAGTDDPNPVLRARAIRVLTRLLDDRYATGDLRPSSVHTLVDRALKQVFAAIAEAPDGIHTAVGKEDWDGAEPPSATRGAAIDPSTLAVADDGDAGPVIIVDAAGFPPEGDDSLARAIVRLVHRGWRRIVLHGCRGHRFIGNGLAASGAGVRIDVYDSSGDYLASGLDGPTMVVHGSAQDQLAQIMKSGTLVVHGDVGQAFMYGAKGGRAFILGDTAGRPLINAVGRPRVVINGTALDYLAESFMAGDPLDNGGFVVLNGLRWDDREGWCELETPYPGGNLFSLASGGAIYARDPHRRISTDQLNGGEWDELRAADWRVIEPLLRENAAHFGPGLDVEELLTVEGRRRAPEDVYRKIRPARTKALQAEEAWVAEAADDG